MALNISPVHRNLHTRVTFLHLEFEDWFIVIGLAALTNICGRWVDREAFGRLAWLLCGVAAGALAMGAARAL